jgi:D-tyrosyl-tRNA(Tyr) deacylase
LQRVKSASVTVDGQLISSIGKGILVLAAVSKDDTEKDIESMASKILKIKLWDDDSKDPPGRVSVVVSDYSLTSTNLRQWKCSVQDIGGEVLCGTFQLSHSLPLDNLGPATILMSSSLSIYFARIREGTSY